MKWHLQPPSEAGAPPRTILFFTGWGMDPAATRHLDTGTCQVWTAWDYSSLAPLPTPPGTGECFLVAWSLGVWAATQMEWSAWPLKAALALNGTPHPRHQEWGIPPAIFDGTAQHWGEPRARQRFLARMTGSQDAAAAFPWGTATPEEQRRELLSIARQCQEAPTPSSLPFTRALVGSQDRIFPPQAQRNAWEWAGVPMAEVPLPHDCLRRFHSWEEVLRLA